MRATEQLKIVVSAGGESIRDKKLVPETNKMRPLAILLVFVAILQVATSASDRHNHHQVHDLNVIATEPAEARNLLIDQPRNSSSGSSGLLCRSPELLDEYCALSGSFGSGGAELGPVCASDGRLYASACELARATCRRPQGLVGPLCRMRDELLCRRNAQEPAQITTGWCSHEAYQLFKLALWREFNSSAALLFDQLDANRDGQLEARELWPKLSAREYENDDNDETDGEDGEPQTSACDTASEFAFERHFHWSPCSLSHLLVHEADERPDSRSSARHGLTRSQFVRLFEEFESGGTRDDKRRPQTATAITSKIVMQMGESKSIDCLPTESSDGWQKFGAQHCAWTRHGVNLAAAIRSSEPHVSILATTDNQPPRLRLIDAQLYLSGVYRCSCYGPARGEGPAHHSSQNSLHAVHMVRVQVLAQPQVSVRPKFQWSLPGSRVAFECQHEHIDTSDQQDQQQQRPKQLKQQAEDQLEWLLNGRPVWPPIGNLSSQESERARHRLVLERARLADSGKYTCQVNVSSGVRGEGSGRLLIQGEPVAASLQDQAASLQDQPDGERSLLWSFHENGVSVYRLQLPEDGQELELVRELSGQSRVDAQVDGNWNQLTLCGGLTPEQLVICEWSDNAILVEVEAPKWRPQAATAAAAASERRHEDRSDRHRKYIYIGQPNLNRVLVFDVRAGELVAVVATEPQPRRLFAFKPNKIHLSKWVRRRLGPLASLRWLQALEYQAQQQQQQQLANANHHLQSQAHPLRMTPKSSRLYSDRVGLRAAGSGGPDNNDDDGGAGQAEASNAQPDLVEDNVRRRFRRHLDAGGWQGPGREREWPGEQTNRNDRGEPAAVNSQRSVPSPPPPPPLPRLVQYDIWLLCYGKPLLVDAQSDLSDLVPPTLEFERELSKSQEEEEGEEAEAEQEERNLFARDDHEATEAAAAADNHQQPNRINRFARAQRTRRRVKDDRGATPPPLQLRLHPPGQALHNQSEPKFTPWPRWPGSLSRSLLARTHASSKEARLRNRKSVQIIQSTFLPAAAASAVSFGRARSPHHHHYNQLQRRQSQQINASGSQALNEFKSLTVLTTHHVIAGQPRDGGAAGLAAYGELERVRRPFVGRATPPLAAAPFDLVQDLCVPERPGSQANNPRFKLHHAYVTHYAERQLYRVAMDTYRYDREIDLHQCDPLALVPAVQGLLIVQCRAPITHQLNGQLVLDELTSARVQFNAQIRAQQAHLTPDARYLVSILANDHDESTQRLVGADQQQQLGNRIDDNQGAKQKQYQQSSVIYVQSVRVAGLEFMYEIKTSLEVAQSSFVWRDGYYAAIFVALNRRDKQTELLSLRLADGRLELIVRVPGLAWSPTARHREPLNVNQELQVASLSTSEGLYLVDLEENRVIQGHVHNHKLRSQQSSLPTQLWV